MAKCFRLWLSCACLPLYLHLWSYWSEWCFIHQSLSRSLGIVCLILDLPVHSQGFLLWTWGLQKCSISYVLAFWTGNFSQRSECLFFTQAVFHTTTYCKWKHLEHSNWNFQQTNMRKKRRGLEKIWITIYLLEWPKALITLMGQSHFCG